MKRKLKIFKSKRALQAMIEWCIDKEDAKELLGKTVKGNYTGGIYYCENVINNRNYYIPLKAGHLLKED